MDYQDINQDTPRLVIECREPAPGQRNFGWGIVGAIPPIPLVGFLARVQSDLFFRAPKECPHPALVVTWDDKGEFDLFVSPQIPVDPLVGMIEMVKAALIGTAMASQQRRGGGVELFGADGKQLRRTR